MTKRILALLLALALSLSLAACGGGSSPASSGTDASAADSSTAGEGSAPETGSASQYPGLTDQEQEAVDAGLLRLDGSVPIITDPDAFEDKYGKITMFVHYTGGRTRGVEELEIIKQLEDLTGIRFEWDDVPLDGVAEKINLMLSSGSDLPDAFWNFQDGLSGTFAVQYADQEVFMPTEDMIENYMPKYKELLDSKPEYRVECTAPDGHIYGFPYVEEMFGLVLTPGPFVINQDWLKKVNKEMPTTVDEWVDCLKAFRDAGDLNGNGKADEVPLATQFGQHDTFGSNDIFYRFTGCFGQADSYCEGNRYADHLALDDSGKVTFTALDEAFRRTAEFFHMLYEEDLIWNGSFEADSSLYFESSLLKEDVAVVGSYSTWGGELSINNIDVRSQYAPIPRLEGEKGKSGFRLNYSELQDTSNTAITTTCQFPHAIAVMLEVIAKDPKLTVTCNWGTAGAVFIEEENGYLTKPKDENGNHIPQGEFADGLNSPRENTTPCRGSFIIKDAYFDTVVDYDVPSLLGGQKVNGKDDILEEFSDHVIPKVLTTVEEASRLSQIQPTISDIVDRYVVDWTLNGVTDESWESYKNELKGAGVEDLVSLWQTAVDRAKSNS
jgi:putative aldouronate transport system substrate-binding protein